MVDHTVVKIWIFALPYKSKSTFEENFFRLTFGAIYGTCIWIVNLNILFVHYHEPPRVYIYIYIYIYKKKTFKITPIFCNNIYFNRPYIFKMLDLHLQTKK